MSISIILQQMGVICILVSIGILLQKNSIVDEVTSKKLSAIVVDICNPALIMASILDGNVTANHTDLIRAAGLGVAFYAVLILIGLIMPRILRVAPDKRKFYNIMCVYTNTGFLGIPIARAVLPPNAIIYVIVINVFYSLLFYTHGLSILGSGTKKAKKRSIHPLHILNPGTVMALLSLVIFWFGISLPPIMANTVEYVGNATVFLSMLLLGVSIARSNIIESIKDRRLWVFIALRMVLLPVLAVLILHIAGLDKTAILAMCLMAAVPVGNLPMIQAEKQGMDTTILSSAIAVTTAASIVTITVLLALATALL